MERSEYLGGAGKGCPRRGVRPRGSPVLSDSGISLLEVLVATALMGLVMVVLLQVLSMALRTQEAARGHYQAVLVAERVLQEYCLLKSLQSGVYQGQDGRFAYEVRLTIQYEVADENLAKKLRCCLIQVTVSWREGGRVRSLNLQTLRTVAQEKA